MHRQSTSLWVKVILALAVGLACYLSTRQPVQADASLNMPTLAPPVPGNLMIYRVGDGSAALSSNATAVFVDEYTTGGTLVQSIPMPTAVAGNQRRLTASGTATSEGLLTLTEDRQYVMLTGYDAAVGTAGIIASTASTINRVVGRVDTSGNVDTSTALSDFASGSNPRSVASTNGVDLWVAGGAGGVRYTTLGSATTTRLTAVAVLDNGRQLKIGGGQLYVTTGSGTAIRLGTVGTGLPTAAGQTVTNLPGFPTSGAPNSFYFADLDAGVTGFDTLYVADEGGTVQKFSLAGGNWIANGSIALTGARGLTGIHTGGTVTLYVTSINSLVGIVDTSGYNAAPVATQNVLATAAANTAFRGVAFAPGTLPTAVKVLSLSAHPDNSTAIWPLIVLGTIGIAAVIIRRSRLS